MVSVPQGLVVEGDVDMGGNAILNVSGITYVTGKVSTRGTADLQTYGQLVAEGNISVRGNGTFYFNPMALAILGGGVAGTYVHTTQSARVVNALQEIFP